MLDRTYTLQPCNPCEPFYIAERCYTARCGEGYVAQTLTICRQARSRFSEAHAAQLALALAKREAELELSCYFEASASVLTGCTAIEPPQLVTETKQSTISQDDAYARALAAANATAELLCE